MTDFDKIIGYIEVHSAEGIRQCLANGVDPNALFRGEPLIHELTSEYARSANFRECVRAFVDHGLKMEDKVLLSVLLDDVDGLCVLLDNAPEAHLKRYSLRCAYTPLKDASLLHICAEFNHRACAEALVERGLDVNVRAGVDANGFGGQTPVFHTVNQNSDQSRDMLDFLLGRSADLDITVSGLIWGEGYEWETLIPSVNPISYAMMGLLPQMHRNERAISQTVSVLLRYRYGIDYTPRNIPNKYLAG